MIKYLFKRIFSDLPAYLVGVVFLSVSMMAVVLYPQPCPSDLFGDSLASGGAFDLWKVVFLGLFLLAVLLVFFSFDAQRRDERRVFMESGMPGRTVTWLRAAELMLYLVPPILISIAAVVLLSSQTADTCVWTGSI